MINKISSIISLSFPVLFLMLIVNSVNVYSEPVKSERWEQITEYHSYNKNVVTVSSKVKSVWTQRILTDYQRTKKNMKKVHDISSLMEINCKSREFNIKQDTYHDDNGKVIKIYKNSANEWNSIRPRSPVEIVYDKICTAPKKPLKKK
jgi:hypothetical protein